MKQKDKDLFSRSSMVPRARKYNTNVVSTDLIVEMRQDRLGHLFYMVTYYLDDSDRYVCFDKMDSVIDFIKSNFE